MLKSRVWWSDFPRIGKDRYDGEAEAAKGNFLRGISAYTERCFVAFHGKLPYPTVSLQIGEDACERYLIPKSEKVAVLRKLHLPEKDSWARDLTPRSVFHAGHRPNRAEGDFPIVNFTLKHIEVLRWRRGNYVCAILPQIPFPVFLPTWDDGRATKVELQKE